MTTNDELRALLADVLADIDAMQPDNEDYPPCADEVMSRANAFGPFPVSVASSTYEEPIVEWPNLRITAEKIRKALA